MKSRFTLLSGIVVICSLIAVFLFLSEKKDRAGSDAAVAESAAAAASEQASSPVAQETRTGSSQSLIGLEEARPEPAKGAPMSMKDLVLSGASKDLLERLEFRPLSNDLVVFDSLKQHFDLSDEQFEEVVNAIQKAETAVRELESEVMEIVREDEQSVAFVIPAFDGVAIRDAVESELKNAMGDELTDFFMMKADHAFSQHSGNFGKLPRMIQIRLLDENERESSSYHYDYEIMSLVLPEDGGQVEDFSDPAYFADKKWVAPKRTTQKFTEVPERFRHLIGR